MPVSPKISQRDVVQNTLPRRWSRGGILRLSHDARSKCSRRPSSFDALAPDDVDDLPPGVADAFDARLLPPGGGVNLVDVNCGGGCGLLSFMATRPESHR